MRLRVTSVKGSVRIFTPARLYRSPLLQRHVGLFEDGRVAPFYDHGRLAGDLVGPTNFRLVAEAAYSLMGCSFGLPWLSLDVRMMRKLSTIR